MALEFTISYMSVAALTPFQVVQRNAARRYLIVTIWPITKALALWPEQPSVALGINPPDGTGTVQLYRATMGELLANDWWATCGTPATLGIIDAWDA